MSAHPNVSVDICAGPRAFLDLEGEWNMLLRRSMMNTIFLTWEWQGIWWDCFGEDAQLTILTVREEGELIGLAPFYVQPSNDGPRTLCLVGGVEVSDYLDIIASTEKEEAVYTALWHFLADEHRYPWDVLDLHNVPATSPTLTVMRDLVGDTPGFQVSAAVEDVCPVLNLPSTWKEYLSLLNKKQRHEVRRKIRKARREAKVTWYYVQNETSLEAEVDDFIRLHQKSHRQKMAFMDQRMQSFFHATARAAFEQGWLKLAFLLVNDAKVASVFCFDYDDAILVYNSGYDPALHSSLSTGIVLLAYCIEDAIEKGRKAFDFLRGEEEYKYRFGGTRTEIHNLRIGR
jgi:CelD/BcsL family acetyltransferase involved in cellulose biosynthesis